jgi:hypothetical protein
MGKHKPAVRSADEFLAAVDRYISGESNEVAYGDLPDNRTMQIVDGLIERLFLAARFKPGVHAEHSARGSKKLKQATEANKQPFREAYERERAGKVSHTEAVIRAGAAVGLKRSQAIVYANSLGIRSEKSRRK